MEKRMPKKWMQSILMIITYTVLLVLALVKFDWILALLGQVLSSCKPLFMGFAIAFVLNRPCAFFCRNYERNLGPRWKKLGRPLAVFTSYLVLIAAIVALFSFILPQVGRSLRTFVGGLNGYIANLQLLLNQAAAYLDWEALDLTSLNSYLREVLEGLLASITNAATHVMTVTTSIISMFVTLVLAVVFSIYMLAGKETLLSQGRRVLRAYLPARYAGTVSDVIRLTATIFTNFVSGQLIEACILGGLCAMGTFFIQADYAPLIGVIVGVSALIPVAGAYIGAILSAFLLVMVSPVRALVFLIFLSILQQIEGNVIYPRVVGTSIGLPGIWVLTAGTGGGGLFGLLGVLLSVPVASVLYTLLRRDVGRRPGSRTPHFDLVYPSCWNNPTRALAPMRSAPASSMAWACWKVRMPPAALMRTSGLICSRKSFTSSTVAPPVEKPVEVLIKSAPDMETMRQAAIFSS